MLISDRCISGLMSNLIKKSWTVSIQAVHFAQGFCFLFSFFYNFFSNSFNSLFFLQYYYNIRLRISFIFFHFSKVVPKLKSKILMPELYLTQLIIEAKINMPCAEYSLKLHNHNFVVDEKDWEENFPVWAIPVKIWAKYFLFFLICVTLRVHIFTH